MLHIIEPGIKGYVEKKRFGLFCCFFAAFGIIMTRSFFFTPEKFRPFYIAIKYNLQKNVPGDKKAIKYKQKFHVYMMFILPFI